MKTTLQKIRIVGNTFIAQPGIEALKIKKTYQHGGGLLGGCLKAGDKITVTGTLTDMDTITFETDITLNRLSESFFYNNQYFVKI